MNWPDDHLAQLSARLAALGIREEAPFREPDLMARALSHSSFVAEQGGLSNERLEMLGDAVLGFAVTEMLFDAFPDAQEGALTRLRASLVDGASLARRARVLQLGQVLALGRGEEMSGGRDRDSALADTFEAVVAALYRSEGPAVLRALTEKLFREEALAAGASPQPADFKTALQERAQAAWKIQPIYRIAGESGRDHERMFMAEAWIGDFMAGRGEGRSKKLAEQQAAQVALRAWDEVVRHRAGGATTPPRD